MVDWQLTEATFYCDDVGTNVSIRVYQNGSTKCTGYKKYVENLNRNTAKALELRSEKLGEKLKCCGPDCSRVVEYKDKLFSE